jgi:hypothetical protein
MKKLGQFPYAYQDPCGEPNVHKRTLWRFFLLEEPSAHEELV